MHIKRIIDGIVYIMHCKKCDVKTKDNKRKGKGKEGGDDEGKGGGRGDDIDASGKDDMQMWTSSFSRLRSTTDISDSPPEDRIILAEAAHNIEFSTTLPTSKD